MPSLGYWEPKAKFQEATKCHACATTFNLFTRRHHCRYGRATAPLTMTWPRTLSLSTEQSDMIPVHARHTCAHTHTRRYCALSFCGSCSAYRSDIPDHGVKSSVRVCLPCREIIRGSRTVEIPDLEPTRHAYNFDLVVIGGGSGGWRAPNRRPSTVS